MNITVFDMQPITPPVGGGRMRLLGLYHALGASRPVTYVGTYDWPNEPAADRQLTPTLREITVPLSPAHFEADAKLREQVGKVVIDTTFHQLAHLSPAYVERAREAAVAADVVVFSHPWIHPLLADVIDPRRQLVVYDAHNVEGMLRMRLLDDGATGTAIVHEVIRVERELCEAAALILACSREDREHFHELYGVAREKIRICPNGVFTERLRPANPVERSSARERLDIIHPHTAIFIGSPYAFNTEAARFIAEELAPRMPSVLFVIAGGVGPTLPPATLSNVRITKLIPEDTLNLYLAASDIALNPMFGGSGTNIKMFAYCAAGLPAITTAIGARGIETSGPAPFLISTPDQFLRNIKLLLGNEQLRSEFSQMARRLAADSYSWERLSPQLGLLLENTMRYAWRPKPELSVIATVRNVDDLSNLVTALESQTVQDFEVILVDEGIGPSLEYRIPRTGRYRYLRGSGADGTFIAQGRTLVFLDARDNPPRQWLERGLAYFRKPGRVAAAAPSGNLFIRHDAFLQGSQSYAEHLVRAADLAVPRPPRATDLPAADAADWIGLADDEFVRQAVLAFTGEQVDGGIVESTKTDFIDRLAAASSREWIPVLPDVFAEEKLRVISLERLLQFPGTDREFTIYAYRQVLGRDPDPEAVENCCRVLGSGESTRTELVQAMTAAEEFAKAGTAVLGLSHFLPAGRPGTIR